MARRQYVVTIEDTEPTPAELNAAVESIMDDLERESIESADHEIQMAQYRALHNRLEDFFIYLEAIGLVASKVVYPTGNPNEDSGIRFEVIETYLDGVNEHEPRGPLNQILQPDLEAE